MIKPKSEAELRAERDAALARADEDHAPPTPADHLADAMAELTEARDAALARAEQAEAQRDRARDDFLESERDLEAVEAERDRYREVLEEIAQASLVVPAGESLMRVVMRRLEVVRTRAAEALREGE